ncbi:MAG: peptidase [Verrucomicrobia bacterium]|nr:peptidase [Verrucomicrobiota bacterium]
MKRPNLWRLVFLALAALAISTTALPVVLPPTALPGLRHEAPFFPDADYRADIPAPDALLGFPVAERAATPEQVEACLKAWTTAAPERTRLVEYARSHEGRPLHYVIVTAPANLERLDDIQRGLARLADPREVGEAEAEALIARLPAVAWLGYTIHGDETEGSDAALALLHYLIASQDGRASRLRERLVIIIDPLMNPDGRSRFLKMVTEHRGAMPNVDDQSLLHSGYWPRGRGNHYLFDLNRDWILGVHPETRGRIRALSEWHPQLFVDAHGMGAQDTHLFSPPRPPINPNIPHARGEWSETFARDQARAFDRQGLVYYTGEWHEEWYPGYSDAYASYRGAVGILYEQARIAEDGVRRREGRILSYRESVRHHVIGCLANLETTAARGRELLRMLWETRRAAVAGDGPYARRTFAILPTANRSRLEAFLDLMRLQGFELFEATTAITAARATDQSGREHHDLALPAGTVLIPNRQPLAHLLAAMLEFDPRLPDEVLREERTELLEKGRSRIYDTTAWNLTMAYGLEAVTLPNALPAGTRPLPSAMPSAPGANESVLEPVAYAIDGADDLSVAAAARLLEQGVRVRAADKAFEFDGVQFVRGSVVVTTLDNRTFEGDLRKVVTGTVAELGLTAKAIASGLGAGDLPDLGGQHFRLLDRQRVALLARGNVNSTDYGAIWFTIDHRLGIRHSHLSEESRHDLARYNVLILPDRWGGPGSVANLEAIKDWVRAGGTLIALDKAVAPLLAESAGFSRVRELPEVLGKLPDYELAVLREWLGRRGLMPAPETVWAHEPSAAVAYPWQATGGKHPDEPELKKRDAWQRLFMPQGALLATRVNTNHWLAFGSEETLPIRAAHQPVLMVADGAEAPVRYGQLVVTNEAAVLELVAPRQSRDAGAREESGDGGKPESKKESSEGRRLGWCALPPGTSLRLRMSGLLWPEAAQRLANSAYVTRESYGRGQIILFANSPALRGASRGAERLLLNAVVYGPGLGTQPPIIP